LRRRTHQSGTQNDGVVRAARNAAVGQMFVNDLVDGDFALDLPPRRVLADLAVLANGAGRARDGGCVGRVKGGGDAGEEEE